MRIRSGLIACLLVLFCAGALAQPTNRPPSLQTRRPAALPEGTKALRDVAYVTNGHPRQTLDLFIPPGATNPLPLIIWVHGGAWLGGSKEQCPALAYLKDGYAVASLNYRLSQHAIFPAQIEDCKAAVRWLRAHAQNHNLDPERFAAWGASAGGHLVALLGTAGDVKKFEVGGNLEVSSRVQAVVDFFGPTDFTQMGMHRLPDSPINHDADDAPEAKLIGGPVPENQDKAAAANPITYVTKTAPPFLIMHGDKDNLVPYQQSELLRDALQKAGVPVTLKIIAGAGHGFGGRDIDQQVGDFFTQQLKPKAISK
jgi:acetyl esterase/lipase